MSDILLLTRMGKKGGLTAQYHLPHVKSYRARHHLYNIACQVTRFAMGALGTPEARPPARATPRMSGQTRCPRGPKYGGVGPPPCEGWTNPVNGGFVRFPGSGASRRTLPRPEARGSASQRGRAASRQTIASCLPSLA